MFSYNSDQCLSPDDLSQAWGWRPLNSGLSQFECEWRLRVFWFGQGYYYSSNSGTFRGETINC